MIYSRDRHEPLTAAAWDGGRARSAIEQIVRLTEAGCSAQGLWQSHPLDSNKADPAYMLYAGSCGVIWALRYLETQGAARRVNNYRPHVPGLLDPNRKDMGDAGVSPFASYLMGDTSILMLDYWLDPADETADAVAGLVRANLDHPSRELMWGSPGTLLAALFMHWRTGEDRWAQLYRAVSR